MSNLNGDQFAKYSAIEVPDNTHEYEFKPLPASMERHAPGEYQPTLPGMEHMLKGEQVHTSVFFPKGQAPKDEWGDVNGSKWWETMTGPGRNAGVREQVNPRDLTPNQDWVDDQHLHEPREREFSKRGKPQPREWGHRTLVEKVGDDRVIQDGHHRAARAILNGAKQFETMRWDA